MTWEPHTCPDDQRPLQSDASGKQACPLCRGELWPAERLDEPMAALLTVETRINSGAFARARPCPDCGTTMTPWRIGELEAWLEKCPDCDSYWVEKLDVGTLRRQTFNRAARGVYDELSSEEQATLQRDLMAAAADDSVTAGLSPLHQTLALLGLPVITRKEGAATPWLTWATALVVFAAYFFVDPFAASYVAGDGNLASAFTSLFAHFGWLHLLGNLYFLVAFGDGVEQKLPRWSLALLFVLSGILATLIQGLVTEPGIAIGGASGAVSALVGACVVLQPRAKVAIGIRFHVFRVPIIAFGLFELAYQALMAGAGGAGVAWTAHLAGLLLGASAAGVARLTGMTGGPHAAVGRS